MEHALGSKWSVSLSLLCTEVRLLATSVNGLVASVGLLVIAVLVNTVLVEETEVDTHSVTVEFALDKGMVLFVLLVTCVSGCLVVSVALFFFCLLVDIVLLCFFLVVSWPSIQLSWLFLPFFSFVLLFDIASLLLFSPLNFFLSFSRAASSLAFAFSISIAKLWSLVSNLALGTGGFGVTNNRVM